MAENILEKFFEHNLWANLQIVQACAGLSDAQLDAEPNSATKGTIRQTLLHLVKSEYGYLSDLTGMKSPYDDQPSLSFAEMEKIFSEAAEGFLTFTRTPTDERLSAPVHTTDGYIIEPWVLLLQAINHATEHREQINSMLSDLGILPPDLDSWTYGEVTGALIPVPR